MNTNKEYNLTDILDTIKQFVSSHKCVSLTSDKESAFISKEVIKFLKEINIYNSYIII